MKTFTLVLCFTATLIQFTSAAWTYNSSTGQLKNPSGTIVGTGYSGNGNGLNNPAKEGVPNVGPIPRGSYSIGPASTHASKGPVVMRLSPVGHNALGRSGFLIHGDNSQMNNSASEGCIILSRNLRDLISASSDRTLRVQ